MIIYPFRSDDPAADEASRYDGEAEWLSTRPKCAQCGEPITDDELYDLGGDLLHAACLDKEFKKDTYLYVRREQVL